ncbi:MAG: thermonuclease family protein [Candidatus Omnitrophica bacterium]|nr:thermonuclease family protein [Candidatus Omnitrophota bacterium]
MVIQKRKKKTSFKKATPWILTGVAFVCIVIRLAHQGPVPAGRSLEPFPDEAVVVRVIDGDTVILGTNQHVRYLGIDTPEIRKKIRGVWEYAPEPYGEAAKAANVALVEGRRVQLEYDRERLDKYGRILAYVRLEDGTLVNGELVRAGLARVLIIPPNDRYSGLFYQFEREAREEKKGIWAK